MYLLLAYMAGVVFKPKGANQPNRWILNDKMQQLCGVVEKY